MEFWSTLVFLIILISFFSAWKDYREKFKKVESEEERRNVVVRFFLIICLVILAIVVFIF